MTSLSQMLNTIAVLVLVLLGVSGSLTNAGAVLPACGAETLLQRGQMFGDFFLPSDQITGQNKKSLNTFVGGMKDSHLSEGHSGQSPTPLYIQPVYLTQHWTFTVQTRQKSHL